MSFVMMSFMVMLQETRLYWHNYDPSLYQCIVSPPMRTVLTVSSVRTMWTP